MTNTRQICVSVTIDLDSKEMSLLDDNISIVSASTCQETFYQWSTCKIGYETQLIPNSESRKKSTRNQSWRDGRLLMNNGKISFLHTRRSRRSCVAWDNTQPSSFLGLREPELLNSLENLLSISAILFFFFFSPLVFSYFSSGSVADVSSRPLIKKNLCVWNIINRYLCAARNYCNFSSALLRCLSVATAFPHAKRNRQNLVDNLYITHISEIDRFWAIDGDNTLLMTFEIIFCVNFSIEVFVLACAGKKILLLHDHSKKNCLRNFLFHQRNVFCWQHKNLNKLSKWFFADHSN